MRRAAKRLEARRLDGHVLGGPGFRTGAVVAQVLAALAHSVRWRRGLLVAQAPPRGLSVGSALANRWHCVCLLDVLKVVCRVEKGPLRLVEDNYRMIEMDQKILRSPIMPARFHSFYNGTDSPSDLIEPVGAANVIPPRGSWSWKQAWLSAARFARLL